jgi:hypothetical protein
MAKKKKNDSGELVKKARVPKKEVKLEEPVLVESEPVVMEEEVVEEPVKETVTEEPVKETVTEEPVKYNVETEQPAPKKINSAFLGYSWNGIEIDTF